MECDVLVIGSGAAGLRTAIELFDKGANVLIVGKSKKKDAHTILATGGINAVLGNMDLKDSWKYHTADTIRDGGLINDYDSVKILCKKAPDAIKDLVKYGVKFQREKNGKITQRFFGAAKYRRACFVGDYTGKYILLSLVKEVEKRKIPFLSETYIFSLLKNGGKVNGALGIDKNGEIIQIQAKVVILATGGHSRIYSRSSSRFYENTGDGILLAYNAGAEFIDMEMFQFHPTGMVSPKKVQGMLVTEAIRGEGGILTNKFGERFMKNYDPDRMELSARDVITKAIFNEVKSKRGTKNGGVFLDISHKPKTYIQKRLPRMYKQFKDYLGIDISKQKMEVGPTAHYSMGGIKTYHSTGKTSVKGLYAVGEVTGGVHGANRLGGNSLAETIVFGKLTGENIAKEIKKIKKSKLNKSYLNKELQNILKIKENGKGNKPSKLKREIQEVMLKYCWVVRTAREMKIKNIKDVLLLRKDSFRHWF